MIANTERDPRVRDLVMPTRVMWYTDGEAVVENPEALLVPGPGQVGLEESPMCVLRHQGQRPGILLDFGCELHGGLQIIVRESSFSRPVKVRVRFGESASEAMSEIDESRQPGLGAQNDHAMRDTVIELPRIGSREIGNSGFRFVRIDLLDMGCYVELIAVRAILLYRDLEYKGSFESSDPKLDEIWRTGAWTVQMNMQEYLWDGIKRDRLVWLGDMHPETMVVSTVFGEHDVVTSSMDLVTSRTPLPRWMNGLCSYSLWWVIIQANWFLYHGNRAYLESQTDYLYGLLNLLLGLIDEQGSEKLPQMRFLDWPTCGNDVAIHAGLQALLVLALHEGATLCSELGNADLATLCTQGIARLRTHRPAHGGSKQAGALLALAGLADPASTNADLLSVDGAHRMSPFYGYYVLQARALAGDYQGCLDAIRSYWGGMLDLGATSFWEHFDLDWLENAGRIDELPTEDTVDVHATYGEYCYQSWRHSLCHGWAGGPTAWLTEHVLGIRPLTPGCGTVAVRPHLGDLSFARGTFPTPKGILRVSHERRGDEVVSVIEAPKGVEVLR